MKKIFISYATKDYNKLKAFRNEIKRRGKFKAIVAADKQNPGTTLADKIKKNINEADFFVPIMTRSSINNQWVNQEIGYTEAMDRKKIFAMIESNIISRLKGFIHNQLSLDYTFEGNRKKMRKEASQFRKCYIKLLDHLERL